jgi:23S rRNA pseudouridine1911/1915/1917 synthase
LKTKNTITVTISVEDQGNRLDKFLCTLPEISSRTFAKDLIDKDLVLINGKTAKASQTLHEGNTIEITIPDAIPTEILPWDFKLDIVFEDSDLIVINKPSGLVVHPSAGHSQDTLVNALLAHTTELSMKNEQRPGIVHRIDKETSGLLVVAKNDFAHEKLAEQFRDKTAHRIYYALLDKTLHRLNGKITTYIARHPGERKRFSSVRENNKVITEKIEGYEGGKWAVTHYSKIANHSNMSYLRIKLETGRTHQIRVHMSEIGHPLVGDILYGYSPKKLRELQITRFFLHAAELGFIHPRTTENLMFKVKWPSEDEQRLIGLGFSSDILSK